MLTLIELGRYTEAIKQGEELLELCESDNQGIRYLIKGDYKKSKKILKNIQGNNEYILEYMKQKTKFAKSKIEDIEDEGTYLCGLEEEAYFVLKDYKYLLETVPTLIEFVEREIK